MRNVFFNPTPEQAARKANNGIDQVVIRLAKYLPQYGYQVVENPESADLICPHAGSGDGNADIAFCHGLYPTGEESYKASGWEYEVNARVINDLTHARDIIVPSQWVAEMLERDLHLKPHVIGWGVDYEEWQTEQPPKGYVLWNKNRAGDVCTPAPMNDLAARAPQVPFISTFGKAADNVAIIGSVPFSEMQKLVKGAAVYLATTKETYGIGTLEALAAGVPVLGYRWGSTREIVEHGVNGFLVEPGDINGLLAGLEYCLTHRETLSANARVRAQAFTWDKVAQRVAQVFDATLVPVESPRVSVVIPCYNYGRFLAQAVESALSQQSTHDFEVIVVNDGSTDNSNAVIDGLKVKYPNLRVITQANQGVAFARNAGIKAARGELIACLDADDKMGEGFIQICADALQRDRSLGIAYTALQIMDGPVSRWPSGFDYERQIAQSNQVPSLCMFRKKAWERAGGYRQRYAPAEDADFWLRITSYGYKAEQITTQALFIYRDHAESQSAPVRYGRAQEPGWAHDKAWKTNDKARPFACGGTPPKRSWPVRNYDNPTISVIIPVGPYHITRFREAIDSVESQTFTNWEIILINDSGAELDLMGMPFVYEIKTDVHNASKARNIGIQHARGEFIVPLDADDQLLPDFMKLAVEKFRQTGHYVYTDWWQLTEDGKLEKAQAQDNASQLIFDREMGHLNITLVPTVVAAQVGGFETSLDTWEDVDFYMKLASIGLCGSRIAQPLVLYNYQTGMLRKAGMSKLETQKEIIRERHAPYIKGEKKVDCGCGAVMAALTPKPLEESNQELMRVRYLGPIGKSTVKGLTTGQLYGKKQRGDVFLIYKKDYVPGLFEFAQDYTAPRQPNYETPVPERIK